MSLPLPIVDPDEPSFRGKTWDEVERVLNERDAQAMGMQGMEEDELGPRAGRPSKTMYSLFPWEMQVQGFAKPAKCTLENWSHSCLKYTVSKQCASLTLSSGSNNALDPAMLDALQDAVMDLQQRKGVRTVLLRAEGKLFCSGFDPKYIMSETSMEEQAIATVQLQFARILYCLHGLPQFTVALLQGSALNGGLGLSSACDLVIAVKGAFFALQDTKLGLVPATSLPYVLRRVPQLGKASDLVLAAANLSAEQAQTAGLVDEVVDDAAGLDREAKAVCEKATLCAPTAVKLTKEVVNKTVGQPPSTFLLGYVARSLATSRVTPEFRAGIEAVKTKIKPPWAQEAVVPP
mmetsp:Transcript_41942/g.98390  ORF Transcript_41942/g.98390 Transcript_41942/m.98390 type:complete len:348 (-) Transcript_41942:151-1194(-)